MKLIFAHIHAQESRRKLKFLLCLTLFVSLISLSGIAAASNWELVPKTPVVGDIIEIRGANFSGETADVKVSFEKDVPVSEGRYEYLLENVEISPGFKNRFSVQAKGAENLNVRVKMILWLTRSADAKGGIATVSQSAVPPGTYQIRIDGKSKAPEVKLKITGLQQMKVESGNFNYKYNTESIPAGNFEIIVGDVAKKVILQPAEDLSSNIANPSDKKGNSKRDLFGDWQVWEILTGGIFSGGLLFLLYIRVKRH